MRRLAGDSDICAYPLDVETEDLTGEKVALRAEVAVSSRSYDLGRKAGLYSRLDVRELWVMDAKARTTHVHRGPEDGGWREILRVSGSEGLSPVASPDLVVRVADAG